MPPPVRSRSATRPTISPRCSAAGARAGPRAARRGGSRRAPGPHEPGLERRVVDRLHRRGHGRPERRQVEAGSSSAPKCRPTKMTGPVSANASSTTAGSSIEVRSADVGPAHDRRPDHLEVVAGVVAEGRPDEALQGGRIARRRPGRGSPTRSAAIQVTTRRRLRRARRRCRVPGGTTGRRPARPGGSPAVPAGGRRATIRRRATRARRAGCADGLRLVRRPAPVDF